MYRFMKIFQRLRTNTRGNVAVMTGLVIVPTIAFIGFAADYGIALSDKAKLDAASDAAAIVALKTAQTVLQGGGAFSSAKSQAQAAALAAYKGNAGSVAFTSLPTPVINVAQSPSSVLTLNSTVTYSTPVTTQFAKVIGIPSINIAGKSAATLTMPTYINYYVIIDVSQSMGIAATATDMSNLYNRAKTKAVPSLNNTTDGGGCVFACHNPQPGDPYSLETLAHNTTYGTPITLRIDAALSAIQSMITSAQTAQTNSVATGGSSTLIQIGLYTMSGYASYGTTANQMITQPLLESTMINTIASPTSNFSALTTLASSPASTPSSSQTPTIGLGANNGTVGYGDSYMSNTGSNSLDAFYNTVLSGVSNGSGINASSPQNYVFIITDGVNDNTGACVDGHCTSVFNNTYCKTLQTKATVGVIYTTYNPIYKYNNQSNGYDQRYSDLIAGLSSNIAPALQSCATSNLYYYEASDGPAITTGMNQLMANSQALARISQ